MPTDVQEKFSPQIQAFDVCESFRQKNECRVEDRKVLQTAIIRPYRRASCISSPCFDFSSIAVNTYFSMKLANNANGMMSA
jgi:hypothetical protein